MAKKPPRKSSGRMPTKGYPNPFDIWIGRKLREARNLAGKSQSDLGTTLGITFQQVQKYERGANSLSCFRLYDVSRVLGVPIMFFFDNLPTVVEQQSPGRRAGCEPVYVSTESWSARRSAYRIAREIGAVQDSTVRAELVKLARTLARAIESQTTSNRTRAKSGSRRRS